MKPDLDEASITQHEVEPALIAKLSREQGKTVSRISTEKGRRFAW
jgi:hypothetical protein